MKLELKHRKLLILLLAGDLRAELLMLWLNIVGVNSNVDDNNGQF